MRAEHCGTVSCTFPKRERTDPMSENTQETGPTLVLKVGYRGGAFSGFAEQGG